MFEARGRPLANRHPPIILLPTLCLQLNPPLSDCLPPLFVHNILSMTDILSMHLPFSRNPIKKNSLDQIPFTH